MNDYKKVLGVVVLFNPDFVNLKRLVDSLAPQVQGIIFIDNSPIELKDSYAEFGYYKYIDFNYIFLSENKGIAAAQNIGLQYSLSNGYSHVLLLDQDSEVPSNMVTILYDAELKLKKQGVKVGAVGPTYIDIKTGNVCGAIKFNPFGKKVSPVVSGEIQKTDYLIASGTMINCDIIRLVGEMAEELFIDLVDSEWCQRCRNEGFDCFVVSDAVLTHSIGDKSVPMLGKNIVVHSDIRHYFMIRNAIYISLYKNIDIKYKLFLIFRLPLFMMLHFFTSTNKIKKLKLMIVALKDGFLKKMHKGSVFI